MGRHVKKNEFKVRLTDSDAAALRDLVRREQTKRQDGELGGATLLREHAMPGIRARLAELKARAEIATQPAGVE